MWNRNRTNYFRMIAYLGVPVAVLVALMGQQLECVEVAAISPKHKVARVAENALSESPEFQAVTDRTTELGAEEMPAYWRLLGDAERDSFEQLRTQTPVEANFRDMLEAPAKYRGQLLRVKLNVRRILAYDVDDGALAAKRLYEVWGWRDDESENLYVVVTTELPDGMSVGASVFERAEVCGYFFKLQGYLPAGAEAHVSPLAAPLLLGRMMRRAPPKLVFAHDKDWWRIGAGTILALSLIGSFASRSYLFKTTKRTGNPVESQDSALFEDWLEGART